MSVEWGLFQSLAACLGEDERLRLELHRAGETLIVLAQPVLKAAPSGLDDERQRLRAALAHPLRLTGTPAQLDRQLPEALATYASKRQDLRDAASGLDALDEALRRARQAAHAQRQQLTQAGKTGTTAAPAKPALVADGMDEGGEDDEENEGQTGDGTDARSAAPKPAALPPSANPDSLF